MLQIWTALILLLTHGMVIGSPMFEYRVSEAVQVIETTDYKYLLKFTPLIVETRLPDNVSALWSMGIIFVDPDTDPHWMYFTSAIAHELCHEAQVLRGKSPRRDMSELETECYNQSFDLNIAFGGDALEEAKWLEKMLAPYR